MGSSANYDMENGEIVKSSPVSKSLLRTRSQADVLSRVRFQIIRNFLSNVRIVIFGTKLFVLFPAIPMVFVAHYYSFRRPWIFALSLIGLTPLAELLSFLTEQIAYFTGPTDVHSISILEESKSYVDLVLGVSGRLLDVKNQQPLIEASLVSSLILFY